MRERNYFNEEVNKDRFGSEWQAEHNDIFQCKRRRSMRNVDKKMNYIDEGKVSKYFYEVLSSRF